MRLVHVIYLMYSGNSFNVSSIHRAHTLYVLDYSSANKATYWHIYIHIIILNVAVLISQCPILYLDTMSLMHYVELLGAH